MSNKKEFVIKFDERSTYWESDYELNMYVVRATIVHVSQMFRARNYLFVREIYERLGLPFTKESIVAGWYDSIENYLVFKFSGDEKTGIITITFSAEEDIRDYF